jgi:hypothetical protein
MFNRLFHFSLPIILALLVFGSAAHAGTNVNTDARKARLKVLANEIILLTEARDAIILNRTKPLGSGSPYRIAPSNPSDEVALEGIQRQIEDKFKVAIALAEPKNSLVTKETATSFGQASRKIAELGRIALLLSILFVVSDTDRVFDYLRSSPHMFLLIMVPAGVLSLHTFWLKAMQFGNVPTAYDKAWVNLRNWWSEMKTLPEGDLKQYFFTELQKNYAPLKALELAATNATERCRVLLTETQLEPDEPESIEPALKKARPNY